MLYAFDGLIFPEVFQSWCAAVRDQTTVQMIAGATFQHEVQSNLAHAVEAGADFLEEELELPYQSPIAPRRGRAAARNPRHTGNRIAHH